MTGDGRFVMIDRVRPTASGSRGVCVPGRNSKSGAKNGVRAKILSNGHLRCGKLTGSIHSLARSLMNDAPANGWEAWYYKDENGNKIVIDELREKIRTSKV